MFMKIINILTSIRNNVYIEFISYIPYIYAFTVVAIIFKPSVITITAFVTYVLAYTFIILRRGKCTKAKDIALAIISTCYTISCVFLYKAIHYIYWKNAKFRSLLLFTPVIYFVYIKFMFYIFGCNPFSNYHFGIDTIISGLKIIL